MSTSVPCRSPGRLALLFAFPVDEVHMLVVHNPGKTAPLPIAQRVSVIRH